MFAHIRERNNSLEKTAEPSRLGRLCSPLTAVKTMKKEYVSISQRSNFEAKLPLDFSRLPKQERSLAKLLSNLRFASAKVVGVGDILI